MTAGIPLRSVLEIIYDIKDLRKTLPLDQVGSSPELASLIEEYRTTVRAEGKEQIEHRIELDIACFMRTDRIKP